MTHDVEERHKKLVSIIARKFSFSAVNGQDLYQEGMIALLRAAQTFDESAGVKFETYASRCIHNRLIDVVRKQAQPEMAIYDDQATTDSLESEIDTIEKSAQVRAVLQTSCTEIERAVFNAFARGHSYAEISKIFDISKKKIDNTIQKIRNKIRESL